MEIIFFFQKASEMTRYGFFIGKCCNFSAKDLLTYRLLFVNIQWMQGVRIFTSHHCKRTSNIFIKNSFSSFFLHNVDASLVFFSYSSAHTYKKESECIHYCIKSGKWNEQWAYIYRELIIYLLFNGKKWISGSVRKTQDYIT